MFSLTFTRIISIYTRKKTFGFRLVIGARSLSHLSCTHATGLGYPLAGNIYVITTHGLFVNDGINELRDSGLIKKLICNDSHVNTQHINDDLVEVRSIDKLIPSVI